MDIGDANTFEVCVRTNSILEKDISLRILIQRGFNSNGEEIPMNICYTINNSYFPCGFYQRLWHQRMCNSQLE